VTERRRERGSSCCAASWLAAAVARFQRAQAPAAAPSTRARSSSRLQLQQHSQTQQPQETKQSQQSLLLSLRARRTARPLSRRLELSYVYEPHRTAHRCIVCSARRFARTAPSFRIASTSPGCASKYSLSLLDRRSSATPASASHPLHWIRPIPAVVQPREHLSAFRRGKNPVQIGRRDRPPGFPRPSADARDRSPSSSASREPPARSREQRSCFPVNSSTSSAHRSPAAWTRRQQRLRLRQDFGRSGRPGNKNC